MESFTMEIAGAAVGVQPRFISTREYCKSYLTDKAPEFFVSVTAEDLAHQQLLLEQEAIEEGLKIRKFTDPFLERTVIQNQVAEFLLSRDTIMLHGSTVALDGKAYLFTAPCGTGKSTHTRLWRELFGARAVMVNDDKPFLQLTPDGVLAYGSPWSGKHGLATNICVPLQGICLLHRGAENVIHRAEAAALLPELRHQTYAPDDRAAALVDRLVQTVPLWQMGCNKDLEAAKVAFEAMREEK